MLVSIFGSRQMVSSEPFLRVYRFIFLVNLTSASGFLAITASLKKNKEVNDVCVCVCVCVCEGMGQISLGLLVFVFAKYRR